MKNTNIGSVSHGTMRKEDLIPCFIWELENQKPFHRNHRKIVKDIVRRMDKPGYYQTEDSEYDLEELFDSLQDYAPPYFYFGSHPGDGADYGFWLDEYFQDDFEELQVNDLSEIPTGYTGECLHINDHGNMSLYNVVNGRTYEIWSIV